jgi:predicted permease
VWQWLADALVLTVLGGTAGLVLAYWILDALIAIAPPDVPRLDTVRFDARTFVFASAASLLTVVLTGFGPGFQASRWNISSVLSQGASRLARSHRMRRAFVVAQVGLALVLLVCAGLVGRSFANLLRIDLGFNAVNVLTLDVTVPDATVERHNQFYSALLARIGGMPGVEAAGAVFLRPLEFAGIGTDGSVLIEGQRTDPQFKDWEQNPIVNLESVTPEYFRAIGIPVVRGRAFTDADTDRTPRVAIVSERLAQRLWPGRNPLGQQIGAPSAPTDAAGRQQYWATVVGVVEDARYRGIIDPRFDLYLAYRQAPGLLVKHLMVRTSQDPLSLAASIRTAAQTLDRTALVEGITTMDQLVNRATAPWRFSASTLGLLGLVALALASLGVYAIVSQSVQERTREIGVRVAVGALPRQVASLVLRDTLTLTAAGIVIGLGVAAGAGRVLTGLLYNVQPADPLTLSAMAALFLSVSTAAVLLPVWRATRVDPVRALRQP